MPCHGSKTGWSEPRRPRSREPRRPRSRSRRPPTHSLTRGIRTYEERSVDPASLPGGSDAPCWVTAWSVEPAESCVPAARSRPPPPRVAATRTAARPTAVTSRLQRLATMAPCTAAGRITSAMVTAGPLWRRAWAWRNRYSRPATTIAWSNRAFHRTIPTTTQRSAASRTARRDGGGGCGARGGRLPDIPDDEQRDVVALHRALAELPHAGQQALHHLRRRRRRVRLQA